MSGKQEIVEVYVKKERKPESSGSKAKGKYNKNRGYDQSEDKYEQQQQQQDLLNKQKIIDKFNNQEKQNINKPQANSNVSQQSYSIEEEKQDFEVKIKLIQEILGDEVGKKQIKNALRANYMNLEETIDCLTQSISNANQPTSTSTNANAFTNTNQKGYINSSSNSLSSDSYLNLRQMDSEEKENKLKLSQKSSDKDSPSKLKYSTKIQNIRNIIQQNLRDEIIIEALDMHQGDVNETVNYLLDEQNVKSLEVCLEEHNQDLNQVDIHLEEIVENIIQEDDQYEFQLMMELQNNENDDDYDHDDDDLNPDQDLYLQNIKNSMSYEEQEDPEIKQFFKMSAFFAKQLEIMNEIHEKNNCCESPEKVNEVKLKKNYSQNMQVQLEHFKEDFLRRHNKASKNQYVMKESEFPSIVKQPSGLNGNIVKEVQKSNQREYNPNKNEWNTTVFQNEDISALGQQYLEDLSSKFPHVDKETLVDIFKELSENYEATQQFLIKHFGKSTIKQDIKIIRKVQEKPKHSYYDGDNEEDEDQMLHQKIKQYEKKHGHMSFNDIRKEIVNAHKYNKAYQYAERNYDTKAKFNLNKYFQSNSMSLSEMKEYSKVIFLRDARQENPMIKIDLHGFYAEEALEILKDQIMYMKKLARQNRISALRIVNRQIQLEIVTGRGSHSQNRISVLKPTVTKFLDMARYPYKADEGKILAKIPY